MQKYIIDVTIEDLSTQRRLLIIEAENDEGAVQKALQIRPDTVHGLYRMVEIPLPRG